MVLSYSQVTWPMPVVKQVCQMTSRAHVQVFGNPRRCHRRLRPQLLRQPHLERVAFAPRFQLFHTPSLCARCVFD